jgi:hypothetical protein
MRAFRKQGTFQLLHHFLLRIAWYFFKIEEYRICGIDEQGQRRQQN